MKKISTDAGVATLTLGFLCILASDPMGDSQKPPYENITGTFF